MMTAQNQKFHSIQALRAIAATMVVFYHAHQEAEASSYPSTFSAEHYLFGFGTAGVHIFFVISGFVMIYSAMPRDGYRIGDFLAKRFIRIFPIYWLCVLFTMLVNAIIGRHIPISPEQYPEIFLLWPGFSPKIIAPAWTLSYEVYFYICFAAAMMLGRARGLIALAVFFGLAVAARPFADTTSTLVDFLTNGLLLEFLAGAGIGWLALNGKLARVPGLLLIIVSVALFAAGIMYGYKRHAAVLMWGVPSIALIAGVVSYESRRAVPALVQRIGHFGDGSYVLYLMHKALQYAMVAALALVSVRPNALLFSLVCAVVCLILGELAYRHVERPMLRRLRRALLSPKTPILTPGEQSA